MFTFIVECGSDMSVSVDSDAGGSVVGGEWRGGDDRTWGASGLVGEEWPEDRTVIVEGTEESLSARPSWTSGESCAS